MRIQHNIAALNSYRQLSGNNSALSKNLEKLSSGYRINRAGDDAAGLAISEKMRAQIKGLEVAQKNANDGISLVQTAEGALTEVHSMLNRMVELATQSANGTYDNATSRTNLQKEVKSLLEEIDRISKSTNFNGINLLDGTMDSAPQVTEGTKADIPILADAATDPTAQVGTKTVLHEDSVEAKGTEFTVALHNVTINGADGDSVKVNVGGQDITVNITAAGTGAGEIKAGEDVSGKKLADAIAAAFTADTTGTLQTAGFTATANADGSVTFKQTTPPATDADVIESATSVTITHEPAGGAGAATKTFEGTVDGTAKALSIGGTAVPLTGANDIATEFATAKDVTVDGKTYNIGYDGGKLTISTTETTLGDVVVGGSTAPTITGTSTAADGTNAAKIEYDFTGQTIADGTKVTIAGKEYTWDTDLATTVTDATLSLGDPAVNYSVAVAGDKVTLTNDAMTTNGDEVAIKDEVVKIGEDVDGDKATMKDTTPAAADPVTHTWNVNTTKNVEGNAKTDGELASTAFTLTDALVKDGASITIGKDTYTFKVGADSKVEGDKVIDLSAYEDGDADLVKAAGIALSNQANSAFTIGFNQGTNQVSIHEVAGQTDFVNGELGSVAEFQKLVYSKTADTTAAGAGKALTLQVGDTAADYQKVTLNIQNTSKEGLGIAGIDISTQDGASAAIDKIKTAINTVSSIRGDLGAVQNRLEHTINNLGVTTENLTAAESRIRDTDMAEEMMNYTKNNILVQAAQAMLAQANTVPQGVLQLLQ